MPSTSSFDTKEYFEIQEFIEEQNLKVRALEWKAYVNRNQKKLQNYWEAWYKRPLTKSELYRLASGSDETQTDKRRRYDTDIEDWGGSLTSQQAKLKKAKKGTSRYNLVVS